MITLFGDGEGEGDGEGDADVASVRWRRLRSLVEVRDFLEMRARAAVAAAMVRGRARLWFGCVGFDW